MKTKRELRELIKNQERITRYLRRQLAKRLEPQPRVRARAAISDVERDRALKVMLLWLKRQETAGALYSAREMERMLGGKQKDLRITHEQLRLVLKAGIADGRIRRLPDGKLTANNAE